MRLRKRWPCGDSQTALHVPILLRKCFHLGFLQGKGKGLSIRLLFFPSDPSVCVCVGAFEEAKQAWQDLTFGPSSSKLGNTDDPCSYRSTKCMTQLFKHEIVEQLLGQHRASPALESRNCTNWGSETGEARRTLKEHLGYSAEQKTNHD